jgi:hypothetical protein
MKIKTTYICEICSHEYETELEAITCENLGKPKPKYNIGDIITLQKGSYPFYLGEEIKIIGIFYTDCEDIADMLYPECDTDNPYTHKIAYRGIWINGHGNSKDNEQIFIEDDLIELQEINNV